MKQCRHLKTLIYRLRPCNNSNCPCIDCKDDCLSCKKQRNTHCIAMIKSISALNIMPLARGDYESLITFDDLDPAESATVKRYYEAEGIDKD